MINIIMDPKKGVKWFLKGKMMLDEGYSEYFQDIINSEDEDDSYCLILSNLTLIDQEDSGLISFSKPYIKETKTAIKLFNYISTTYNLDIDHIDEDGDDFYQIEIPVTLLKQWLIKK